MYTHIHTQYTRTHTRQLIITMKQLTVARDIYNGELTAFSENIKNNIYLFIDSHVLIEYKEVWMEGGLLLCVAGLNANCSYLHGLVTC